MTATPDWESYPHDLSAVAPRVGPFVHRPFLEAVWNSHSDETAELHLEVSENGAAGIVLTGGVIEFAGQENLTDYHSPLGSEGAANTAAAVARFKDTPFVLDSLPIEAAEPVREALESIGIDAEISEHGSTAVLPLPSSFDDWLGSLGKKQRHEVRRKRRRFEAEFGEITLELHAGDAIGAFCAMHRLSAGEKGQFMTQPMQDYFTDLIETAGASIHMLLCDGIPRAAAFGFETDDAYYYYNSAYDPAAAMASPGIVLFSSMIEAEIDRGAAVFDFLKGDEPYKYRHGAEPRTLYAVTGRSS